MQTSLAHHILLDKKSAEIYIGGSVKTLGRKRWFKLSDLHNLEVNNLKNGIHTNAWFISNEAAHEPILTCADDKLFGLILHVLKKVPIQSLLEKMKIDFFDILAQRDKSIDSTDRTIGGILEALRTFNKKYPEWMDELWVLVEKLSKLKFFKLWN
jgi:hypothetical protein